MSDVIIESDYSSGVELVRRRNRWGVRINGDIRWAASAIEAMGNYCEHVAADRKLDAPPAPRRPVAGWYERSGSLWLRVDDYLAQVDPGGRWTLWLVTPNPGVQWIARRSGIGVSAIVGAPITWSIEAAQLAAEDALRAVLVDAAAALGLRVVPS